MGYIGSKGTHLLKRYDDNFSPPGPGNVNDKRPYRSIEIPGTGVVSSPLFEEASAAGPARTLQLSAKYLF